MRSRAANVVPMRRAADPTPPPAPPKPKVEWTPALLCTLILEKWMAEAEHLSKTTPADVHIRVLRAAMDGARAGLRDAFDLVERQGSQNEPDPQKG